MSGICSAHIDRDPNCRLCRMTPADIFGKEKWEAEVVRTEAAGIVECHGLHRHWSEKVDGSYSQDDEPTTCGYKFYATEDFCPLCGSPRTK